MNEASTPKPQQDAEEGGASDSARPLERLADEDLMQITGDSESRAFAMIYDRHSGPAYSLAYRILGSRGAAEDAVQETFLTVWRTRSRYMPERGSVRTWVLGISPVTGERAPPLVGPAVAPQVKSVVGGRGVPRLLALPVLKTGSPRTLPSLTGWHFALQGR